MLLRRNTGQRFGECFALLPILAEQTIQFSSRIQSARVVMAANRPPIDEGLKMVSNHYCPKDLPIPTALWCFLGAAVLSRRKREKTAEVSQSGQSFAVIRCSRGEEGEVLYLPVSEEIRNLCRKLIKSRNLLAT